MRRLGLTASIVLISAGPLAQERTDQAPIRTGVELVQIDVSVLDNDRRPVRGLTAADFTLRENGVTRPIRAFTAVDIPARTRALEPAWSTTVVPDVATNQVAEREGRLVVILMDRSIPYMGVSAEAQKIAIAAVEQLGPNDLAALVSTSGAYTPQNFTSDRARLVKAILQRDWSTESTGFLWSLDDGGDGRCLCGLCVLETVTQVSEAVRDIPRRRKALLFIGRGIAINMGPQSMTANPGCEPRLKDTRQKMFDSLAVSNLTVHSIDPRGLANVGDHTQATVGGAGFDRPVNSGPQVRLQALKGAITDLQRTQLSLTVLPDRTGGRTVVNTNAPADKIADIFRESEAYYILGFERDPSAKPETRRSIEVKVARPNVRTYTQRQFITPDTTAVTTTPSAAAASSTDALRGLLPDARRPLALNVAAFAKPQGEDAVVHITLDAGAFAREADRTSLEINVTAVDQFGKPIGSAKQTSALAGTGAAGLALSASKGSAIVNIPTHLDLAPGNYEIRAAITEPGTGTTASVFTQLAVPEFAIQRLSMSDIAVETGASAGRPPDAGATALVPTTQRVFARSEQVRAFLQIYQGTARTDPIAPVTVRVRVLDAQGTAARDQSLVFGAADFQQRRVDCRLNLPIDRLAPGDYLLDLTATAGQETASRKVRFAVK
jgi:VWFA-related protein